MNLDRARAKLQEIWRLAELLKGCQHDDHTERRPVAKQVQREVERAQRALKPDPEPPAPDGRMARLLKHKAQRGYEHTSLALAGWRRDRRLRFLSDRAQAGDTAVIFYIRAMDWPGVFDGVPGDPQPTFDRYGNPAFVHRLVNDIEAVGLEPIPVLMDNTETDPQWRNHHERIVGGLRAWGDRVSEVCLGIEANLYFGQWDAPPEAHISDALLNEDETKPLGLQRLFPDLEWGWHGQGWLPVRGADVYWHQWDWDSHRMSRDDFIGELHDVQRAAAGLGQRFFASEFAQHREASEADADRMRGWLRDAGAEEYGC